MVLKGKLTILKEILLILKGFPLKLKGFPVKSKGFPLKPFRKARKMILEKWILWLQENGEIDNLYNEVGKVKAGSRKKWLKTVSKSHLFNEFVKEKIIPFDFAQTKEALTTNIESRREAEKVLNQDGVILIFPSGAISTKPKIKPL